MKMPKIKTPTIRAPKFKRSPLPSLAKAPDPLKGVDLPDDIEESPKEELTAVQEGFRERAAQEAQRFQDATDTGYYSCLVFENRDQLDAFLSGIGMLNDSDLYLDGREVAKRMGIELPPSRGVGGSKGKVDPTFANLAR